MPRLLTDVTSKIRNPGRTLLLLALTSTLALSQASPPTQTPIQPPPAAQPSATRLRIRILNAQTNKPVTDEQLNVALRAAQIGSVAMATDKNGLILVDTGHASTIRILSNFYADCRARAELYTDYPIATVRATGITTGNLCSSAAPAPKPNELLLFVIPKTYIPKAGEPPNTHLPHSDENSHAPNS